MEKVQEATTAKREWMNSKMQAQQKVPLTVDPVVKVSEIKMATEVRSFWKIYPSKFSLCFVTLCTDIGT